MEFKKMMFDLFHGNNYYLADIKNKFIDQKPTVAINNIIDNLYDDISAKYPDKNKQNKIFVNAWNAYNIDLSKKKYDISNLKYSPEEWRQIDILLNPIKLEEKIVNTAAESRCPDCGGKQTIEEKMLRRVDEPFFTVYTCVDCHKQVMT